MISYRIINWLKFYLNILLIRYIPEIVHGDKRILIIGGRVVPYALARIPQKGETRGNLAAGGQGVAQPLSERDRQIAETLAPELVRRGILLAGLDVIGDYLTEINVTSPTGFQEISKQTDCDVAALFADAVEEAARLHGSPVPTSSHRCSQMDWPGVKPRNRYYTYLSNQIRKI